MLLKSTSNHMWPWKLKDIAHNSGLRFNYNSKFEVGLATGEKLSSPNVCKGVFLKMQGVLILVL